MTAIDARAQRADLLLNTSVPKTYAIVAPDDFELTSARLVIGGGRNDTEPVPEHSDPDVPVWVFDAIENAGSWSFPDVIVPTRKDNYRVRYVVNGEFAGVGKARVDGTGQIGAPADTITLAVGGDNIITLALSGARGPAGPSGEDGAPGSDGAPGADGEPGTPGVVAATGLAAYDAETQTIHVDTPTAADVGAVPTSRTVAGKALSANVALDASDVGADPEGAAADAVAALREIAAGIGTQPNTGVTGFLGIDAAARRRAGVEVGNTSTETTMLSSAINYAANHFNLNRVLQLDFGGLYNNNSAANRDVTVRVKLQGKTVFAFAATAIPSNATVRFWRASCRIQFGDFVGTRAFGFGSLSMSAAGAGFDLGQVTAGADLAQTFDLAASMALDVTVQHSTNNSNLKMSVANFYATELLAVT